MLLDTSTQFFNAIHKWLSFISKKRMDFGFPILNGGADIAMLFLSMKLVISTPKELDGYPIYPVYPIAKPFMSNLMNSALVSVIGLQATVLVALYEYSHGIYPAAWVTVGTCGRYAELLGLSSNLKGISPLPSLICLASLVSLL
jgi:hypothetical protein